MTQSFLKHFNHFRISTPVSPVFACYSGVSRNQCIIPSLPSSPSPQRGIPFTAAGGQAFVRLNAPSHGRFLLPPRPLPPSQPRPPRPPPRRLASRRMPCWRPGASRADAVSGPRPLAPGPHPGDASCQKTPPDASPNFGPTPQPIEKQGLTTSRIKMPHTPNRCVTRVACSAASTTPVPGVCRWLTSHDHRCGWRANSASKLRNPQTVEHPERDGVPHCGVRCVTMAYGHPDRKRSPHGPNG